MTVNEIRFVCGTETRHNTPVANSVFPAFELGLAKAFGGFTRTEGHGGFIMADGTLKTERCMVYDVAISTATLPGMTRSMAAQLASMADQECVYFRDIDGSVEFVEQ